MPADIPRLLPDEPLPRYTFVPGRSPHPISDPAGHSFGQAHVPPAPLDPARWADNRDYLRGVDLFNHGYYWEAHEAWEGLWRAAVGVPPSGGEVPPPEGGTPTRSFLKALIKLAAAGVKHLEGKPAGVASHARRAAELLREVDGPHVFLGLRIASLIALAASIARDGWPDVPPTLWPSESD